MSTIVSIVGYGCWVAAHEINKKILAKIKSAKFEGVTYPQSPRQLKYQKSEVCKIN